MNHVKLDQISASYSGKPNLVIEIRKIKFWLGLSHKKGQKNSK